MTLKGTVLTRGILNDGRNNCSDLILGPQIVSNTVGLLNNETNQRRFAALLDAAIRMSQPAARSAATNARCMRAAAAAAWGFPLPDSTTQNESMAPLD
jgi:hypothetical protein